MLETAETETAGTAETETAGTAETETAKTPKSDKYIKALKRRRETLDNWREHRKNPSKIELPMSRLQFVRYVRQHVLTAFNMEQRRYNLKDILIPAGQSHRALSRIAKRVWRERHRPENVARIAALRGERAQQSDKTESVK